MANKFLDSNGLTTLWSLIKSGFVAKVTGKDLSTNDYTTDENTKLRSDVDYLAVMGGIEL